MLLEHVPSAGDFSRASATDGGEHAGPCPSCGGDDRFRVWPKEGESGRFWCRRCDWSGDGIDLLRSEHGGCHSFPDACRALGCAHKLDAPSAGDGQAGAAPSVPKPDPKPPRLLRAPGKAWQAGAGAFVEECQRRLWAGTAAASSALDYLTGRGLTEKTIRAAGVGLNGATFRPLRTDWGLPRNEKKREGGTIWLPRGIVIPWYQEDGSGLWKIQIRRPDADTQKAGGGPKYVQAAAVRRGEGEDPGWSSNALYGASALRAGAPAMLVEGAFDALAIMQEARDEDGRPKVAAVACGSGGGRRPRWIAKLASCSRVLLGFDTDDNEAGDDAAAYWESVLPDAVRHAPPKDDPAAMLEGGEDLRAWIKRGLDGAP